MAEVAKVHAKLMAASGARLEIEPGDRRGAIGLRRDELVGHVGHVGGIASRHHRVAQRSERRALDDPPSRDRGLAVNGIDDVPRAVGERLAKGRVDLAFVLRKMARDDRDIALRDLATLELPTEFAMRLRGAGEDHDTRGRLIEAMHDAGLGESPLHSRDQAIGLRRPTTRHREQARGLDDAEERGRLVDQRPVVGGGHRKGLDRGQMEPPHQRRAAIGSVRDRGRYREPRRTMREDVERRGETQGEARRANAGSGPLRAKPSRDRGPPRRSSGHAGIPAFRPRNSGFVPGGGAP